MHAQLTARFLFAFLLPALCCLATSARAHAGASSGAAASSVAAIETAAMDADGAESGTSDAAAIRAYRNGDLATARSEWIALLDDTSKPPRGFERGRILYDLGNVAFREGHTLEAVGWYAASLRLRPRDADTWANLEEARNRAKLDPADRGDLSSTLRRVLRSFTPGESRWLAGAGLLVLAGALAFEALRGGRLGRSLGVVTACLALVACLPCIDHALRDHARPGLVIELDKALLRSEPREKAAVTAEIPSGAEVERVDELPDWTKVRVEGGLEGWLKKSSVFALDR